MPSTTLRPPFRRAAFALALLPVSLFTARAPAVRSAPAVTVVVGRVTDGSDPPVM